MLEPVEYPPLSIVRLIVLMAEVERQLPERKSMRPEPLASYPAKDLTVLYLFVSA